MENTWFILMMSFLDQMTNKLKKKKNGKVYQIWIVDLEATWKQIGTNLETGL